MPFDDVPLDNIRYRRLPTCTRGGLIWLLKSVCIILGTVTSPASSRWRVPSAVMSSLKGVDMGPYRAAAA